MVLILKDLFIKLSSLQFCLGCTFVAQLEMGASIDKHISFIVLVIALFLHHKTQL